MAMSKLSQHVRVRGHPCGLQDALATLRPSCSPLSLTTPPWTHDALRMDGYPLPDRDFHPARDAKLSWRDNAGPQPRLAAAVRYERRLLGVGCPGRIGDYSTAPPTEPYVKISLIRFLGTARFHTARLPDVADNPRHPSPSALQHVFSRLPHVHRVPPGTIPSLSRSWAGAADTPPSSDHTLGMRLRVSRLRSLCDAAPFCGWGSEQLKRDLGE